MKLPMKSSLLPSCCLVAVASCLVGPALADPPKTPMLMIEAGMHIARVGRLGTDASGRMVLTCSDDKTARLWFLDRADAKASIARGHAGSAVLRATNVRTFRVPIGEMDEGNLYASALSPDGTLAALGGSCGREWDGTASVYLFDTVSGRMIKRLTGLPSIVSKLAFSASGRYLAAGLGGKNGIRVWDMPSGQPAGEDKVYVGDCYGLTWHGDEALATSSLDGRVRTYKVTQEDGATKVAIVARAGVSMGRYPFGICYSPDGKEIAVGFDDTTTLAVISAENLAIRHRPTDLGVGGGNLSCVAWSPYGNVLAAGGKWAMAIGGARPIRLWGKGGQGGHLDVPVARQTLMDLQPLVGGGFVFTTGEPAWGVLTQFYSDTARPHIMGSCPTADFRNHGDLPVVSANGETVGFDYAYQNNVPADFSLGERRLAFRTPPSNLYPPRQEGLGVTNWEEGTSPKFLGQPIRLQQFELSRSLAIAWDNSFFVLGCDWTLRRFSAQGKPVWAIAAPSVAWGVNISRDGRFVIATYGDGTIRWHRADTGEELLALFAHADRKRWVVWAPHYEERHYGRIGVSLSVQKAGTYGGLIVEGINENSPAQAAGLRIGDEILTVNDIEVKTTAQAIGVIKKMAPGSSMSISFMRDNQRYRLSASVGESPETYREPLGAYYDCSASGESLIGWHVNRGPDQEADFFPASQFRDQYYRPDVVRHVLLEMNVGRALRAANAEAGRTEEPVVKIEQVLAIKTPPVVELLVGGATGQLDADGDSVNIRYRVRQGSSPVVRVRVLMDGRPMNVAAPVPKQDTEELTATIPVPAQDCVVTLLAENGNALSSPATLRITRWKPVVSETPAIAAAEPPPPPPDEIPEPLKPKLYLLSAGIANYEDGSDLADLKYAAKDARDFAAAMQRQEGGLYQKVETRVLTDADATADSLLDGLEWVRLETTSKDVAVIFMSGHGENDNDGRYFFCPHNYDPAKRKRTGVSMDEIQSTLSSVAGKVIFFIDSCHAGNALGKLFVAKGTSGGVDVTRLVNELSSAENGAVVFASSTGRQVSLESDEWQNGAFTKALVEGLDGRADLLKNGKITVSALETWVAERVKELSRGQQTPTVAKPQTIPDFPFAVRR